MDENPYWTACRVALGREPRNYEFIPWIAAQHRDCFGPGVTAQTAEQIAEFTAWLQERYPVPTYETPAQQAQALLEELNTLEQIAVSEWVNRPAIGRRYDAVSATIRALGFDIGPAGDGALCLI